MPYMLSFGVVLPMMNRKMLLMLHHAFLCTPVFPNPESAESKVRTSGKAKTFWSSHLPWDREDLYMSEHSPWLKKVGKHWYGQSNFSPFWH